MQPVGIAVITARGGSKGLPRKNVLMLAGKPLIEHTIEAALLSGCFAHTVVSTDDDEIREISVRAGAEVLWRPSALATDVASSLDVLEHALRSFPECDYYALLQPTSPLRTAVHLREAVTLFRHEGNCSCVSITLMDHPPEKCLVRSEDGRFVPLFSKELLTAPRQHLRPSYRINGAIYLGYVATFLASKDLFAEPLRCYEMAGRDSVDIDSADDFAVAELMCRTLPR